VQKKRKTTNGAAAIVKLMCVQIAQPLIHVRIMVWAVHCFGIMPLDHTVGLEAGNTAMQVITPMPYHVVLISVAMDTKVVLVEVDLAEVGLGRAVKTKLKVES
jgi:hypothetical protein